MKKWISVVTTVFLAASMNAQSVAPNEVKVFRHPDWIGDSASYKVEEGMRHKLVVFLGNLDNDISSMLIGAEVAVMAFQDSDFNNWFPGVITNQDTAYFKKGYLQGFKGQWNDSISSLVVFRVKDFNQLRYDQDPWGVYLYKSFSSSKGSYEGNRFIPMPEDIKEIEVRHGLLGNDWDNKLDYVRLHRQLEITLYDQVQFQGEMVYLPGASPESLPSFGFQDLHFPLGRYDFAEKASSLVLRIRGAVPPPPERKGGGSGTVHRAPPAGDTPKTVQMKLGTINLGIADISGVWKSNIGLVYEIVQDNDKFTWIVTIQNQLGEGLITGDSISATWSDRKGRGSAKGKIIKNREGKAIRIEWSNGVVFTR